MMGRKLPSSFGEEPSSQLSQVLFKGRHVGTPAWTAQHPPYTHGAYTGNSHSVKMQTLLHLF